MAKPFMAHTASARTYTFILNIFRITFFLFVGGGDGQKRHLLGPFQVHNRW